jgi:hypothetical protein
MSRPSNQTVERYYFELFRSHYAVPDGELVFTDRPDVIVRGAQTIGIEIANLYITCGANSTSEQVQRARRVQTLERAQSLRRASGGRRIELSVDFHPEHPIQENEIVAQTLAAVAKEVQNSPSGQVSPFLFEHVPELRFLYLSGEEYIDAKWRLVQCYSVPSLSVERLRELVSDKVKKLQAYQPCDVYWLLLVVDFMDPAQDQDLQWPAGVVLNKSPFERILLYKPQLAQVVQVPQ